ncbi:hypothetical protein AB1N83_008981 [Pleurotus pulmonarius]
MLDYCKAVRWRASELFRSLVDNLNYRPLDDPRRPASACPYCWNRLLGPRGWLRRALNSPLYRLKLHPKYVYRRNRNKSPSIPCTETLEIEYKSELPPVTDNGLSGGGYGGFGGGYDGVNSVGYDDGEHGIGYGSEYGVGFGREYGVGHGVGLGSEYGGQTSGYGGGYGGAYFSIVTAHSDPAAYFISERSEIHEVNSARARSIAEKCISECLEHHDRCPRYLEDPALPTRVIDCQDPTRPKLVTFRPTVHGKYLALSYVRGEPQPHCTNTQNVSIYHEGIDIAPLPKTIRDAINLTHSFGISYLWIDTLCIIQDSHEDKVQQLAQMPNIYSQAYFTIIAASASKVGEGFLQDRSPPPRPDTSLPIWCSRSRRLGTVSLRGNASYYNEEAREHVLSADSDPIHDRGWCLQEYFLSPRALVYTSRTLQYHCQMVKQDVGAIRNNSDSERFFVHPKGLYNHSEIDWRSPDFLQGGPEWDQYMANVLSLWGIVLQEYSRRCISYPSDKLMAFAGVAERFQALRKSQYYAGLWEDTLILDLLWETLDERGSYPSEYRGPSWSWAALDNEVQAYYTTPLKGMKYCKVVRCVVHLADESVPFGAVKSAELVLEGPLVQVVCSGWGPKGDSSFQPGRSRELYLSGDGLDDIFHAKHLAVTTDKGVRIGDADFDRKDEARIEDLWAIPLMWRSTSKPMRRMPTGVEDAEWFSNVATVEGLLLTPSCVQSGPMKYRRVGRWSSTAAASKEPSPMAPAHPAWIDDVQATSTIIV